MKQSCTVIEFGTSKIICLTGYRDEGNISISGCARVYYDGIRQSNWVNPDGVADALKKAIDETESQSRRQIRDAYVGVPACYTKTLSKTKTISIVDKSVTASDIENLEAQCRPDIPEGFEIVDTRAAYFIDSFENVYINDPIGINTQKLTACYVYSLAFSPFISDVKELLGELNINVWGFVPETLAQALHFIPQQDRDNAALLIDIGYYDTCVSVVYGDSVLSSRVIHAGGADVAEDISRVLGADNVLAENLKRSFIFGMDSAPDMRVFAKDKSKKMRSFSQQVVKEIVENRSESLLRAIYSKMRSVIRLTGKETKVFITGGGLMMQKGCIPVLERNLKRKPNMVKTRAASNQSPVFYTAFAILDRALDAVDNLESEKEPNIFTKLINMFFTSKLLK